MDSVASIYSANQSSVIVKTNGSVYAFGTNYDRACTGTNDIQSVPKYVMNGAPKLSGGQGFNLFTTSSGVLWGVGENTESQLGTGAKGSTESSPVMVSDNVAMAAGGEYLTVILKNNNELWITGLVVTQNDWRGSNKTSYLVPTKFLDNVTTISSGNLHHLALRKDGTLWVFGSNTYGQFGNGTAAFDQGSATPIRVNF